MSGPVLRSWNNAVYNSKSYICGGHILFVHGQQRKKHKESKCQVVISATITTDEGERVVWMSVHGFLDETVEDVNAKEVIFK